MPELRLKIDRTTLAGPDLPLALRFAEEVDPVSPQASATNQEMESNPQYENNPTGPSMRPWRSPTDGGRDANTDFAED
jgi:hypothetical protein